MPAIAAQSLRELSFRFQSIRFIMYRSPYRKIRSCFKRLRFSGRHGKACEQDFPSALFVVRSLIEMLFEPVHGFRNRAVAALLL